jgi:hypothetical protein
MGDGALTVAILIAFPVVFGLFWSAVVLLISRVGWWHRLAADYACPTAPQGESHSGQTGVLGLARYKFTLTVTLAESGLHFQVAWPFRIGHPALLVPWSDVASVETGTWFGFRVATIRLSKKTGATIEVYGSAADPIAAAWKKRS